MLAVDACELHNTWEPEKNILDKALIDNYQRSESRRRKSGSTPNTSRSPSKAPRSPTPQLPEPKKLKETVTVATEIAPSTQLSEPLTVSVASPKNSTPAAHSGSSSIGTATVSSIGSPRAIACDTGDGCDWRVDNRLRPTTLLVTAASASAANTRMAVKGPWLENSSRASTSPPCVASPVKHPRIRLKIPRERLLSLGPVVKEEENSSSSESSTVDEVELPRRNKAVTRDNALVVIPKCVERPDIKAYSPEAISHPPIGLKLQSKRFSAVFDPLKCKDYISSTPSLKRRKKSRHGTGEEGRRSSSSSCVSISSGESPRRLAPLRIQLSRNGGSTAFLTTPRSSAPTPSSTMPPSIPDRDISITDVTVGGLTVTIKECSTPKNFFGLPTCQVVTIPRPPLAPRPIIEKTEAVSVRSISSKPPPEVIQVPVDENAEPQPNVVVEGCSKTEEPVSLPSPSPPPPPPRSVSPLAPPPPSPPPPPPPPLPKRTSTPVKSRCEKRLSSPLARKVIRRSISRKCPVPVKKAHVVSVVPPTKAMAETVYAFHGGDSPPPSAQPPPPPPPALHPVPEPNQVLPQPTPPPSLLQLPSVPPVTAAWESYFKTVGFFPQSDLISPHPPPLPPPVMFPTPFMGGSHSAPSSAHLQLPPHLLAMGPPHQAHAGLLDEMQPIDLSTGSRR
ncbi:unnamed protein product [Mesocestoides corti]|uniref:Uncharacterized protein n=1 Tax=Mesocestoides corti TaxID=53468 RepID=A0A0R3U3J1_MESCO|nr:unnamed protein product [Mesocestoides corti]